MHEDKIIIKNIMNFSQQKFHIFAANNIVKL